jgi:predicted nucleic acid-binding protein
LTLVLDASAALRAMGSAGARAVLSGFELIGPPLLRSEVTSALHEALWRRQIDEADALSHREAFAAMSVAIHAPDDLHEVAWAIATEIGLAKTYDAEYLALARLRRARVLTTDARLRRGAARTGLVIDPSELGR